ncbi:MAG: EVE domain-containing protein [Bacteroidota bacterium]|jgi:predicted RNA-binding protein with PUA-like domain
MSFWLIKSEPFVFSFSKLMDDGISMWDGVRNYGARNFLRAMEMEDILLFYHSNEGLEIVGIAKVLHTAYPDPTAEKGDWSAIDIVPVKKLNRAVSLKEIKQHPELQDIGLIKQSRLSVMPVTEAQFDIIMQLAETKLH